MSPQPLSPAGSSLAQRLAAGRFVITAEVVPPVSCNPEDLTARALPLRGLADAVNVTDGAGARAHMGATAAAALLIGVGVEPILQLTCRDRNRIALQSELMGAAALGVRNLLLLRGDDPTAGDQPDAKPVFDLNSRTLTETASAIRDGRLPHGAEGRKICVETIEELSLIPGVAGVHIMAPGNAVAIPEVIAAARRSVTMAAKVR